MTDATPGWNIIALGGTGLEWLEGSDETLLLHPHVRRAAQRLRQQIDYTML